MQSHGWPTFDIVVEKTTVDTLDTYASPVTYFSADDTNKIFGGFIIPDFENQVLYWYYGGGTWNDETDRLEDIRARVRTAPMADIPVYSIFEVNLTASGSYNNPYLKMPGDDTSPGFVVGTFTGPDDRVIEIDGFWDGGNTWKIRMAPTAVGIWTYSTSSSDAGLNGKTGSFNCVPSTSHGFVRIHPDNPHSFAYDDGTPFFWLGDTHIIFYDWDDAGVTNFRYDDGTYQAYWDTRASQGFTSIYFGSWLFRKPGNFAQNEGGYNFNNSDPDQLNPMFWQWADKRLEYVVSKGMVPGLGIG